jgi:glycosyltransferase involved in cell wall biosynthesis
MPTLSWTERIDAMRESYLQGRSAADTEPVKLRVCLIGRTMPAHRGGTGMFHPYLLAGALASRGHDVLILTTARTDAVEFEHAAERLTIRYLRGTPPDRYSDEFWRESAAAFDGAHAGRSFDVVISDSAGAAGWARLSQFRESVPIVAVCHAGLSMMVKPEARAFYAQTQHPLLERADAIIADSQAAADSVAAGLGGARPKLHVIPNAADPALFEIDPARTAALRRSLGLGDGPVVLNLGRVVPEKGGEDLLRAVAAMPEPRPRTVIIGPGAYGSELRQIAGALCVPFTLVPGTEHRDVGLYLSLADVFVMPTRHQEGLPFTLAEAMMARRPVVACDIGGVSEIVRHEQTGLLVRPGDIAGLSAAMLRLLREPGLARRLADAGRALALERFSLGAMVDATVRVLLIVRQSRHHFGHREPAHLTR